ncbi:hypothetical protein ACFQ9V_17570 [Leifsonia sp. NPDC056665]|uniref:hypothetical protein n=1 Tax=Leifsonia sp. NPDC056665 TaxID=3345901 RepID=UPI0036B38E59
MDDPSDAKTDDRIELVAPHVERVLSASTGKWVGIYCDCPIGIDHTYAEWIARYGGRAAYGLD